MNRSSSPIPVASGEHPIELTSVAAIVAALASCRHPPVARVSAGVAVLEETLRVTWCAACGALASEEGDHLAWQPTTLASLLGRSLLGELSVFLHRVRQLRATAESAPDEGATEALRELRDALSDLTRSRLARDAERIDDALAELPSVPPVSSP